MTYTDSNNITFSNVTDPGLVFGGSPIAYNGAYPTSGDTVTFSNDNHLMVNAIDIDWNGAEIGNNITINTTGDLITWIKGIETSSGNVTVENKNATLDDGNTTIATINGTDIKLKARRASEDYDGYMQTEDFVKLHPDASTATSYITNTNLTTIDISLGSGSKVKWIDSSTKDISKISLSKYSDSVNYYDQYWYIIVPATTTDITPIVGRVGDDDYTLKSHVVKNISGTLADASQNETNIIQVHASYMGSIDNSTTNDQHFFVEFTIAKNLIFTTNITDL